VQAWSDASRDKSRNARHQGVRGPPRSEHLCCAWKASAQMCRIVRTGRSPRPPTRRVRVARTSRFCILRVVSKDAIEPPIPDGSGYHARSRDLMFLGIDSDALDRWRSRRSPLGMSAIQYDGFRRALLRALERDDLSLDACDIRLKGSSAEFFSGHHKQLPRGLDAIVDLFRATRGRMPESWEISEIEHRLRNQWITDGEFPRRRPFDSLYRLSIAREQSDVDLQIASDEVVRRCEEVIVERGLSPEGARLAHPVYDFVQKDLIESATPHLYLFALRASDALNRHVSLAIFPSSGPRNTTQTHGPLSAHFRDGDWKIVPTPAPSETSS